jgi:hypothetical protein
MEDTDVSTDRELLEETWRTYDAEFAPHVEEFVHPSAYLDTDEQLTAITRPFMFFYALGSVAGARAVAPEAFGDGMDPDRIQAVVDTVADIHESEEFAVSAPRITEDVLGE